MVRIFCKNTGTYREYEEGTPLMDMVADFDFEKPWPILSARVNNVAQGLRFKVYNNRDVEFLDYTSYSGRRTYCRSLTFLLFKAAKDLFPNCKVLMRRPISKGYYCIFLKEGEKSKRSPLMQEDLDAIVKQMRLLVEQNLPFYRHEVRRRWNSLRDWTIQIRQSLRRAPARYMWIITPLAIRWITTMTHLCPLQVI